MVLQALQKAGTPPGPLSPPLDLTRSLVYATKMRAVVPPNILGDLLKANLKQTLSRNASRCKTHTTHAALLQAVATAHLYHVFCIQISPLQPSALSPGPAFIRDQEFSRGSINSSLNRAPPHTPSTPPPNYPLIGGAARQAHGPTQPHSKTETMMMTRLLKISARLGLWIFSPLFFFAG